MKRSHRHLHSNDHTKAQQVDQMPSTVLLCRTVSNLPAGSAGGLAGLSETSPNLTTDVYAASHQLDEAAGQRAENNHEAMMLAWRSMQQVLPEAALVVGLDRVGKHQPASLRTPENGEWGIVAGREDPPALAPSPSVSPASVASH